VASLLNCLIVEKLKSPDFDFIIPNPKTLIPIPLYWYKENVRGFNQSVEIGRAVAGQMAWKFVPDLLVKRKQTVSQVELSGEDRRQNLKGVFSLNPNYVLSTMYSVLIFDDVFTTGSTLREAAKALKRIRVERVWGLTIAR
jgi:ComF family protein